MQDNYLVCRKWNGSTDGPADINIAKPPELKFSVTSETIDGVVYNYSGYSKTAQTRVSTAAGGGTPENEVIVPRYLVNSIIYAIAAPTFVQTIDVPPKPIAFLDLNVGGRAWSEA
jgi:hypothetical protein